MNRLILILACLMPLPVLADPPKASAPAVDLGPPLTAAEFEAYAQGKTLTYGAAGQVWGQEEYLPGRQVVWAFTGQPCQYGSWTQEMSVDDAPLICFLYEDDPEEKCWEFFKGPTGLVAQFIGDGGTALAEVAQTSEPMNCPGPKVGV